MALLETRNLTKRFKNFVAVDHVNLQVNAGEVYGFIGPNGAGKTTVIRMLVGLIHPTEGEVYIDGHHVGKEFRQAIKQVGAIIETPYMYGYLTARQNLTRLAMLDPQIDRKRVDEVLELVRLTERADDKVKGYSLGMRQRLGIAQALLSHPKLVILDEPANGLDPQGMFELRQLIKQLASEEGIAFFISSHILHDIEQICDRVGIIQQGHLIREERVDTLLEEGEKRYIIHVNRLQEAYELLQGWDWINEVVNQGNALQVRVDENRVAELNRQLIQAGYDVVALIPTGTSLEESFLQMTGGRHVG
ncbi:ABC transporter ATP-binding protein [Rubeoparvulum massiliense]|uniref:ABC transporter ATP-binding protein n=1 Tax=Rubeoparvulum massiliense TaxID=1631346 RepID=UPI00065E2EFC|nr:ABC transporter ATP-binding protein [Rubeoparvulum massiliense]